MDYDYITHSYPLSRTHTLPVYLSNCVLSFHKHGMQGKSLLTQQVTNYYCKALSSLLIVLYCYLGDGRGCRWLKGVPFIGVIWVSVYCSFTPCSVSLSLSLSLSMYKCDLHSFILYFLSTIIIETRPLVDQTAPSNIYILVSEDSPAQ